MRLYQSPLEQGKATLSGIGNDSHILLIERGETLLKKIEWPSKKARQGMKEKYPAKKGLPLTGEKFLR